MLELEKSLEEISSLTENNPSATVIVGGDFNAGDIDWITESVPMGAKQRNVCLKVLDVLTTFNLEQ